MTLVRGSPEPKTSHNELTPSPLLEPNSAASLPHLSQSNSEEKEEVAPIDMCPIKIKARSLHRHSSRDFVGTRTSTLAKTHRGSHLVKQIVENMQRVQ